MPPRQHARVTPLPPKSLRGTPTEKLSTHAAPGKRWSQAAVRACHLRPLLASCVSASSLLWFPGAVKPAPGGPGRSRAAPGCPAGELRDGTTRSQHTARRPTGRRGSRRALAPVLHLGKLLFLAPDEGTPALEAGTTLGKQP